ncbi:DUF1534 domain-containing protein, partial [Pseudomonas syringae pv. actinidiae]|nr:DUF1534 domain-containing protein [Pseudomonas syringae pv. actinidiae]
RHRFALRRRFGTGRGASRTACRREHRLTIRCSLGHLSVRDAPRHIAAPSACQ